MSWDKKGGNIHNMIKLKKIVIITLIICILFPFILFPNSSYAILQEVAGRTIAEYAEDLVNNHSDEFIYSWADEHRQPAYKLQKTSGISDPDGISFTNKYGVDCVGFVNFVVHNSIGIGGEEYTEFVVPGTGVKGNYFEELSPKPDINSLQKGDIIWNDGHVMVYIGDGKVAHSIHEGLSIDGLNSFTDGATDYEHVARIKESTAASVDSSNCTRIFGSVTGAADDYGLYYGTTTGSYAGSYTFGQWLFNKFAGFFDYLAGIITYVFRMQFLGWGNIIEELINYTINKATGVETVVVDKEESSEESSEEGSTYSPGTEKLYTPTATNTNNRLDVEDIIYNRVPFLDVNFLDVNLDRYKKIEEAQRLSASEGEEIQVVSEDSIVYSLRANIAKWYIVIRQICIIVLLLLLIYLGIRLAISTTGGDKAKYKGMLWAWLASFIVVFCIHYYMMIVIDINEVLVDIFAEVSENAIENSDNGTGSQSIYDTMRTRAYSLKLSEGFPATIFYLVLIYFLVRFLFIYIKRYFTIMILALMGPIMAIKNCFDKISKGTSKSMSKWMYDFALNVFLQTIHAILYCMFMVIAFDLATDSVVGFVMSLIVLNFIFKAEKIFMNIFNFEGRASSLSDVNENKNYFAEAYKVGMGVTMFGGTALKYGVGAVAGSGKFLGEKALSGAQIGTSAFNRLSWSIRNRRAIRNGQDPIEYTPVDLREKLKDKVENTKNNVSDRLNDFIYNKTGKRSARLDLHNMKKQDPLLYDKTKEALKLKKDLKWKTLKRTFGDSTRSIRYMAELMVGVPMLIIDTQSGISTLSDATSGLSRMNARKKEYGYKRTINGRKGNFAKNALNAATFGAVNATLNSSEKMKKEIKKIKENYKILDEVSKANNLEFEIEKEIQKMITNGDKDKIEDIMKNALKQVVRSNDVKKAISEYMYKKGVKDFSESDLNEIIDNINNKMFEDNVDKIVNKYMTDNEKEYLDKQDFDNILNEIEKKTEDGVSSILNDNSKMESMKNINPDVEKITIDYMSEKGLIKLEDEDLKEIDKRVNEQLYTQVKEARDKFMKEEKLDKLSAEQVKELLKSDASHSSFGIDVTEEVKQNITKQFENLDDTGDKKKAFNAIQDAIAQSGTTNSSELAMMMRELKTHREKVKNDHGKTIIDITEFTKGIKEKLK